MKIWPSLETAANTAKDKRQQNALVEAILKARAWKPWRKIAVVEYYKNGFISRYGNIVITFAAKLKELESLKIYEMGELLDGVVEELNGEGIELAFVQAALQRNGSIRMEYSVLSTPPEFDL